MVHKLVNRKPSSKPEVKEPAASTNLDGLLERVETLEKHLDEILATFDADLADRVEAIEAALKTPKPASAPTTSSDAGLADRVEALEQTLQRHGIRRKEER